MVRSLIRDNRVKEGRKTKEKGKSKVPHGGTNSTGGDIPVDKPPILLHEDLDATRVLPITGMSLIRLERVSRR